MDRGHNARDGEVWDHTIRLSRALDAELAQGAQLLFDHRSNPAGKLIYRIERRLQR
jgi:hypothetical protein